MFPTRCPFLKGPKKFSHPESHSKISNLLITELFYLHILNTCMTRSSLQTRSFRCIQLSVFRYRLTKNGFVGPKSFWGFRETRPWNVGRTQKMSEVSRQLLVKRRLTDQSMRTMFRYFIMQSILSFFLSANQSEEAVQSANQVIWLTTFYLRFPLLSYFASRYDWLIY